MDRLGGTARKVHEYVRRGEYEEAIRIAERLNYDKVSNLMLVMDAATAYDAVGDKAEAKDILLRYYKNKGGKHRNLLEFLIELCIVTDDIDQGVKFCLEFEDKWPGDPISLIMRYRIIAAADGSLEEQARYLEQYKQVDFDERWGYELCEIYYRMKALEPCVNACHDLIQYFGKGEYVEKAVRMKNSLVGLSPDEVERLRSFYPNFGMAREEEEAEETTVEASLDDHEEPVAETEEEWPESLEEEIASAQKDYNFVARSDEELQKVKSQYHVDEKLKQTEEIARQRKLKEQQEEEARRLAEEQAAKERNDMISSALHSDHYEEVEENRKKVKPRENIKPLVFTGLDTQATVNELLHNFREAMWEEEGDDVEYITVGRHSEDYAEAIEERIRSEITMLSEEQVRELTPAQVKELYELTVLHDVNNRIAALVKESMEILPDVDMEQVTEEMEEFIREDALNKLVEEMNAREAARLQAEEAQRQAEEAARRKAEAEAEARARAANIAKMEEEARRKRAEAKLQEALKAQEAALQEVDESEGEPAAADGFEAASSIKDSLTGVAEAMSDTEAVEETASYADTPADTEPFTGEAGADQEVTAGYETDTADQRRIEVVNSQGEKEYLTPEEASFWGLEEENSDVEPVAEADADASDAADIPDTAKSVSVIDIEKVAETEHTILDEIQDPDERLSAELFQSCVVARAKTRGYSVDDRAYMTIQVLYDEMAEEDIILSKNLAIILADTAIARCGKGGVIGKLFKGLGKKDNTVLKDRHFDWNDKMIDEAGAWPADAKLSEAKADDAIAGEAGPAVAAEEAEANKAADAKADAEV